MRACAPLNVLACAEQDQPDAGLQVRIATKRAVDPWHLGIQKFIAGFEVDFEYRPTNLEWPGFTQRFLGKTPRENLHFLLEPQCVALFDSIMIVSVLVHTQI